MSQIQDLINNYPEFEEELLEETLETCRGWSINSIDQLLQEGRHPLQVQIDYLDWESAKFGEEIDTSDLENRLQDERVEALEELTESVEWESEDPEDYLDFLDPELEVVCDRCGQRVESHWDSATHTCASCYLEAAKSLPSPNVSLTGEIEPFYKRLVFSCSREDYQMGEKTSYTTSSWFAHHRHNRTTYDHEIRDLDQFKPLDRFLYARIKNATHQLILSNY